MSRIVTALSNVSKKVATNVARPASMIQECSARINATAQMQAAAAAHVAQRVGTMTVSSPVSSIAVRTAVGGSMASTGALQQFSKDISNGVYELCAVPKKKISPHKRRIRKAGQWVAKLKKHYKPYQICLACNKPMLPHTICTENKQCLDAPRI